MDLIAIPKAMQVQLSRGGGRERTVVLMCEHVQQFPSSPQYESFEMATQSIKLVHLPCARSAAASVSSGRVTRRAGIAL